ncbi:hypothetical protein HDU67_004482 [Dinochytrium kinnereticum]|nr:hypothetical protein HDU67_004482 [Dinochytrium kinnereticum]
MNSERLHAHPARPAVGGINCPSGRKGNGSNLAAIEDLGQVLTHRPIPHPTGKRKRHQHEGSQRQQQHMPVVDSSSAGQQVLASGNPPQALGGPTAETLDFGMLDTVKVEPNVSSASSHSSSTTNSPLRGFLTPNVSESANPSSISSQPVPRPAIDQPTPTTTTPTTTAVVEKTKRRKVSTACVTCQKAHVSCEEKRPCQRCIRRGEAHLCTDAPRKAVLVAAAKAAAAASGVDDCAACPIARRPLLPMPGPGGDVKAAPPPLLPCQELKKQQAGMKSGQQKLPSAVKSHSQQQQEPQRGDSSSMSVSPSPAVAAGALTSASMMFRGGFVGSPSPAVSSSSSASSPIVHQNHMRSVDNGVSSVTSSVSSSAFMSGQSDTSVTFESMFEGHQHMFGLTAGGGGEGKENSGTPFDKVSALNGGTLNQSSGGGAPFPCGLLLSDIQSILGPMDATFNDLFMSCNLDTDVSTLIPPCMPTENVVDLESLAEAWASTLKECDGAGGPQCTDCPVGKIKKDAAASKPTVTVTASVERGPPIRRDDPTLMSSSSPLAFCGDGSLASVRHRRAIPHREIAFEVEQEVPFHRGGFMQPPPPPPPQLAPSMSQIPAPFDPQMMFHHHQPPSHMPMTALMGFEMPQQQHQQQQQDGGGVGDAFMFMREPTPVQGGGGGVELEAMGLQHLQQPQPQQPVPPPAPVPAMAQPASVRFKNPIGDIQSYDYAKGYRRLDRFLNTHMSAAGRTRVLAAFSRLQPAFHHLSTTRFRNPSDDFASELALRTVIAEHLAQIGEHGASILNPPPVVDHGDHGGDAALDALRRRVAPRPFGTMSGPAVVVWRRTGEVVAVSEGFSDLLGLEAGRLVFGAGCGPDTACGRGDPDGVGIGIHEVLTEDSAVALYEGFADVAVEGGGGVLRQCDLRDPRIGISCAFGGPDELAYPGGGEVDPLGGGAAAFCVKSGPEGAVVARNGAMRCALSYVVRRDFKGLPVAVVGTFVPALGGGECEGDGGGVLGRARCGLPGGAGRVRGWAGGVWRRGLFWG